MSEEVDKFMFKVGEKLKKKPESMKPFIDILNENWYDSIDSLKEIDADTWASLKFPSRLVKVITQQLRSLDNLDHDEEMVDTNTKKEVKSKDIHMENNDDQENLKYVEEDKQDKEARDPNADFGDLARLHLRDFYKEANDDNVIIVQSLKTLTKIIDNLMKNPWEPKFRSLDITKKAVKDKIAKYDSLIRFLKICSFEEVDSKLEIKGYPGELLRFAFEAISSELKDNSKRFGVKVKSNFNAYEEGVFSTTGSNLPKENAEKSKYNPEYINKMIEEEKQLKKKLMERTITERDVIVFNTLSGTTDFKKVIQEYDEENKKEDEAYEEKIRETNALKLLGDNAKTQKFGNKRLQEFNKLRDQKVYGTGIIRIKFPDGLVLQGKFGAREKIGAVFDFVLENLHDKSREFVLFKAPPKKVLTNKSESLKKAGLIPSGMIFFQWVDEELAVSSETISLDMKKLKEKVKVF